MTKMEIDDSDDEFCGSDQGVFKEERTSPCGSLVAYFTKDNGIGVRSTFFPRVLWEKELDFTMCYNSRFEFSNDSRFLYLIEHEYVHGDSWVKYDARTGDFIDCDG